MIVFFFKFLNDDRDRLIYAVYNVKDEPQYCLIHTFILKFIDSCMVWH
jgi:hypothetical protein